LLAAQRRHPLAETIETHGCSVVLRRVDGRRGRELFLHCAPPDTRADAPGQAEAVYRAIAGVLAGEGADCTVIRETAFLRDLRADLESVRAARPWRLAAASEVEQPPLDERARLEVSAHAIVSPARTTRLEAPPACACAECARAHGLLVRLGDEEQLHVGALYGGGEDAYAQALAMFRAAEDLLRSAGMTFQHVVRTWIHLRDIDRDYGALNRARREFFAARGIDPPPASTGIGGGLAPHEHDLSLGLYAVRAPRRAMSAPTLGEAMDYGSDFARGMRVVESNKVSLHVSGTASIDEQGRTAHPDDLEAQVERMLVNVAALLAEQGAGFADVVSAVTYLKHPADTARLRRKLRDAGFEGFPNALVAAPICRPELLCETELVAVLPGDS